VLMRPLPLALLLLSIVAVIFLPGCSGASMNRPVSDSTTSTTNMAGNWELHGTSQTGAQPAGVVGGIAQTGSHISGNVFVLIPCDNAFASSALTGSVNGNAVTFNAPAAAGETFFANLTLNASASTASGTYSITGGCAAGDHGTIAATKVPPLTGTYTGTATADADGSIAPITASLTQSPTVDSFGVFELSGNITFTGSSCLVSGPLDAPGVVLGSVFGFGVSDSSSTVDISGHYIDPASNASLTGTYQMHSGPCDGATGTISLTRQ
jgi:hypothetical protein